MRINSIPCVVHELLSLSRTCCTIFHKNMSFILQHVRDRILHGKPMTLCTGLRRDNRLKCRRNPSHKLWFAVAAIQCILLSQKRYRKLLVCTTVLSSVMCVGHAHYAFFPSLYSVILQNHIIPYPLYRYP